MRSSRLGLTPATRAQPDPAGPAEWKHDWLHLCTLCWLQWAPVFLSGHTRTFALYTRSYTTRPAPDAEDSLQPGAGGWRLPHKRREWAVKQASGAVRCTSRHTARHTEVYQQAHGQQAHGSASPHGTAPHASLVTGPPCCCAGREVGIVVGGQRDGPALRGGGLCFALQDQHKPAAGCLCGWRCSLPAQPCQSPLHEGLCTCWGGRQGCAWTQGIVGKQGGSVLWRPWVECWASSVQSQGPSAIRLTRAASSPPPTSPRSLLVRGRPPRLPSCVP